jgi:hypothetical protein
MKKAEQFQTWLIEQALHKLRQMVNMKLTLKHKLK